MLLLGTAGTVAGKVWLQQLELSGQCTHVQLVPMRGQLMFQVQAYRHIKSLTSCKLQLWRVRPSLQHNTQ